MSEAQPSLDVVAAAAGLASGHALHAARRFRGTVVEHTQASHDALLFEAVAGLHTADRLRVAVHCCNCSGASALAAHYRTLLVDPARAAEAPASALPAMLKWAELLTREPRLGDRAAMQALQAAGLTDAAIVALAQLVAFLSYQTRVVAGLRALAQPHQASTQAGEYRGAQHEGTPVRQPTIRINGFTNEPLQWRSWLQPVKVEQATPMQLEVLDASHAQARSSDYYLTLIHQPRMLQHRSAAYNAIMYANGGAPRAERELGAMVVSVTNGCVYCSAVHAQRYAQLARRTDTVEQVFTNPSQAGSSERERTIAHFAQAVTQRPESLSAQDMAPLRALGLRDEEIIDLLHASAIFAWANRLMHNLGEPVLPQAPASLPSP